MTCEGAGKRRIFAIGFSITAFGFREAKLQNSARGRFKTIQKNHHPFSSTASDQANVEGSEHKEKMWREIRLLAASKPVIVSMSDVAASGGYYMAMAADAIVAEKRTFTCSIGVVTGYNSL